jgi:DNA-binding PadR family transcriptional regulator
MPKGENVGEFEYLILLSVIRLRLATAVELRDMLAKHGRPVALPGIHVTLKRLEDKRCLRSRLAQPVFKQPGRPARIYYITLEGSEAVARSRSIRKRLEDGILD